MHDPFSDLLSLVSARSVLLGGLVTGGAWSIAIPPPETIKFWYIVRGNCWLDLGGEKQPIALEAGDVFLMSAPRPVIMASDLTAPQVDLTDILKGQLGAIVKHGDYGDDFFMIGGKVELDKKREQLFLDALPPTIHVRATSKQANTLHLLMDLLIRERETVQPGAGAASAQLAHLMFIHILRDHFETSAPHAPGWLRAVSDQRLAPALQLIHADPARSWQLAELAKASAMSRATFAAYFKTTAGLSPVAYLTTWRMHLAKRALQETDTTMGALAQSLGYGSESAFSTAFKRITGSSPRSFRSSHTAASSVD